MNQAKLTIQWNKTTGDFTVNPENMTVAETLAIMDEARKLTLANILTLAKKSLITVPGLKGD